MFEPVSMIRKSDNDDLYDKIDRLEKFLERGLIDFEQFVNQMHYTIACHRPGGYCDLNEKLTRRYVL